MYLTSIGFVTKINLKSKASLESKFEIIIENLNLYKTLCFN